MSHVAGKAQVRDRAGYELIIQFLCAINFVPTGHTAHVEMTNPVNVFFDIPTDIPVSNLQVMISKSNRTLVEFTRLQMSTAQAR